MGTGTVERMFLETTGLAKRIAAEVTRNQADHDDFVQFALLGLWNAARRFDSSLGVPWVNWAAMQVRRAVLDGMRTTFRVKRGPHRRGDVTQFLNIDVFDVASLENNNDAMAREAVAAEVERLDDRERALVYGHYYAARRLDEISAAIGISKSWGTRIHQRAIRKLRKRLARRAA